MRKVVVSGIGLVSPLGLNLDDTLAGIDSGRSGVKLIPEWEAYQGFRCRLGASLPEFEFPGDYTAKATRCMGRGAKLAVFASEQALREASLFEDPILNSGRVGVAYGSGTGSPAALSDFSRLVNEKSARGIKATTYLRMMSHTCAANIGVFFGLTGRIIPSSCACSSGSLALGYAFEAIKSGAQDIMIAGGAEELDPSIAVIFDVLCASSQRNSQPEAAVRPFDSDREGLVTAEGACTLILEEEEHALQRGIKPIAELLSFASNSDGTHMIHQNVETISRCMQQAVSSGEISSTDLGYISAHATGTVQGDSAESQATFNAFGSGIPISSLKGHLGHSLGASGSTSSALAIAMMNRGEFAFSKNLQNISSNCADLDYIMSESRKIETDFIVANNFAFGGINTSIIFKRTQ